MIALSSSFFPVPNIESAIYVPRTRKEDVLYIYIYIYVLNFRYTHEVVSQLRKLMIIHQSKQTSKILFEYK